MSEPRDLPHPVPAAGPRRPFRAETAAAPPAVLTPLAPGEAERLGTAFAAMDPWKAYALPASRLATFFATDEPDAPRRAIRLDGVLVGAMIVRHPWLHGPYLQFLGLLPEAQGRGVGAAVLDWMEREAQGARNLWLCVSAINTRAAAFYRRHGFEHAASLDALVSDGMDEILMRKRLF